MRVALYARVSRHDKDQNPENQLIKLRSFAERHQWTVYREYVDYASGAKPSRPQFDEMLKDARARRFDAIVIVRIDRLARSTRHLLNVLESLQGFGVDLVCTDQEIDTKSPAGKLPFTVLGAVSELELDLIRERTKDGLARARAQGKRLGRLFLPARTEEILRLRGEQGLSLRQIGARLSISHQGVKQRLRRARLQKRLENHTRIQTVISKPPKQRLQIRTINLRYPLSMYVRGLLMPRTMSAVRPLWSRNVNEEGEGREGQWIATPS